MAEQGHGGLAAAKALTALGVDNIFTLSGSHIFPIYDGCKDEGIRIVDFRHEQNAGFAAEGWSRITRGLGVAVVTAGPGPTNVMSPLAQASMNSAPLLVLAGRAPAFRWGQGSLQEIDHVPFVDPLAPARTVLDTSEIASAVLAAGLESQTAPRRPRFLDFPQDVLYSVAEFDVEAGASVGSVDAPDEEATAIARLIEGSQRPVIMAGSNVWLDSAENELRALAEAAELPVFMNGQGRGTVPGDHRLAFSRSRSAAFKGADLVIVAGTPLDFRVGFGQSFAPDAKLVHLDSHPDRIAQHVGLAGSIGASLKSSFKKIAEAIENAPDTKTWIEELQRVEQERRDAAQADLHSGQTPIHPLRVYGELVPLLERDTAVVCDGGDFVSFAGREIPSYEGGCWLDPGPFGCLGVGPGYAIAAAMARPGRKVALVYGDGAVGFGAGELESFVRHGLPIVAIVGNNGIWGLEKFPMQALFGYDVAAELRPGIRYDQMMVALGGKGELVSEPDELAPALRRAFDSGEPYLVNVITDPTIPYPRAANLA